MKITIELTQKEQESAEEFIKRRRVVGSTTEGTPMWTVWQKVADAVEKKEGV